MSPPNERPAKRRPGAMQTIRRHRLFPALVALWFAALFGLGLLVVPAQVLAKLVSLPAISPVFQLGAAAGVAGLAGLAAFVVARKLSPPRAAPDRARTAPLHAVSLEPASSETVADSETAAGPLLLEVESTPPPALGAQHPLESAPLDSLGPVELLERLALSLNKNPAPADLSPLPPIAQALAADPGDFAASAPLIVSKDYSSHNAQPEDYQHADPLADGEYDPQDDEDQDGGDEDGEDREDTESAQHAYSSLLNVRSGRMARVREGVIQLSTPPQEVIPFPLESLPETYLNESGPMGRERADQAFEQALERLQRLGEGH